ncbi:MAG: hypothetical protein QOE05_1984 [Actinomycetota bacterium]|nr:hypothetical protein [Actinomycetota bacterium]
MTKKPTTTSYAVLGLLAVRPWTTYELAKQVQRSLNWFWPRAERKLYDEPKRLVEQGLATAVKEQTGRRARTLNAITKDVRRAMRDWLSEPPVPPALEFEGMVKVFFAEAGTLQQLLDTLERIEDNAMQRLRALSDLAATRPLPFPERGHLNAISLRLQFEQEDAVARWARWARKQAEQWTASDDPGSWRFEPVLDDLASSGQGAKH